MTTHEKILAALAACPPTTDWPPGCCSPDEWNQIWERMTPAERDAAVRNAGITPEWRRNAFAGRKPK